ncbi:pyruvate formate-lyase-activating protein [Streptococcus suis]
MMTEIDYRKVTGLVHSTESFGSVDGPGVRFVVFMQGCHMRCQYCHNPDTWDLVNPSATERTAEDVLNEALRFRMFWGKEGGITVSGGEATIQVDFLIALFTLAKEKGIHTTLDTCALTFRKTERYLEKYSRLMEVTDLVLLDIKEINSDQHRIVTGHSNKTILECARYLSNIGKPVWIRHVLVPGLTDRDEDLIELGKFVKTLTNVERFEVLPYHNLGEFKWRELGRPYPLEGTEPPTKARVENAKALMETESYQDYLNRIKG